VWRPPKENPPQVHASGFVMNCHGVGYKLLAGADLDFGAWTAQARLAEVMVGDRALTAVMTTLPPTKVRVKLVADYGDDG
jgi:hypothetical protein